MDWLDTALNPKDFWGGYSYNANSSYCFSNVQPIETSAFPHQNDVSFPALTIPVCETDGDCSSKWTTAQDMLLTRLVKAHGTEWIFMARYFQGKTPSSLKKRWTNKLDPNIKKQRWTNEENDMLLKMFQEHGGNWKLIAKKLPGRPSTIIKNHFWGMAKRGKFLNSKGISSSAHQKSSSSSVESFYGALKLRETIVNGASNSPIKKMADDSVANSFLVASDEGRIDLMSLKLPKVELGSLSSEAKEDRLHLLYKCMSSVQSILEKAQEKIRKLDEQISCKLDK